MGFKTQEGLYEWLVIPFSHSNAPSTFMHIMHQVFKPFIGKFVVVYFDDILIHIHNEDDYLQHLREVSSVLSQYKLFINLKKCTICSNRLSFLGQIVSAKGKHVDTKGSCQQSVTGQPHHSHPSLKFSWLGNFLPLIHTGLQFLGSTMQGREQEESFNIINSKLSTAPILTIPCSDKLFEVNCDASIVNFQFVPGRAPCGVLQ